MDADKRRRKFGAVSAEMEDAATCERDKRVLLLIQSPEGDSYLLRWLIARCRFSMSDDIRSIWSNSDACYTLRPTGLQ